MKSTNKSIKKKNKVFTKITVDEDSVDSRGNVIQWLPSETADLRVIVPMDAAGKREINLPYRNFVTLDCGFNLEVPENFKVEISATHNLANRGLVVTNATNMSRVKVAIGNIGKEIIKIEHGDIIAKIYPVPVYEWEFS